jgi:hypothetical protein
VNMVMSAGHSGQVGSRRPETRKSRIILTLSAHLLNFRILSMAAADLTVSGSQLG